MKRREKNFPVVVIDLIFDLAATEGLSEILGTALSLEECLFCSKKSNNLEDNLDHMAQVHSFFLPDYEYITNLSGLIEYLGMKENIFRLILTNNQRD